MDWEPIYWCKDEKEISKEMLEILKRFSTNVFDYYPNNSILLSRCDKCVYQGTCGNTDVGMSCPHYKRDPPDGGYYG